MNDFKSSLPVSDPLSIFCLFQISRIYSVGLYAQLEVDIKSYTNSLIETIFFFKKDDLILSNVFHQFPS